MMNVFLQFSYSVAGFCDLIHERFKVLVHVLLSNAHTILP